MSIDVVVYTITGLTFLLAAMMWWVLLRWKRDLGRAQRRASDSGQGDLP